MERAEKMNMESLQHRISSAEGGKCSSKEATLVSRRRRMKNFNMIGKIERNGNKRHSDGAFEFVRILFVCVEGVLSGEVVAAP